MDLGLSMRMDLGVWEHLAPADALSCGEVLGEQERAGRSAASGSYNDVLLMVGRNELIDQQHGEGYNYTIVPIWGCRKSRSAPYKLPNLAS